MISTAHLSRSALLACTLLVGAAAEDGSGLAGTYYSNVDFTGSQVARIDKTINFDWGGGPGIAGVGPNFYSVVWKGQVRADFTETYTFTTTSDDGVMVWVNGKRIIDNWSEHGATDNSASVALTAGTKYDIVIKYYQGKGGAVAKLAWSSPSVPKAIIPTINLFPQPKVSSSPLSILAETKSRVSPAWIEGTVQEASTALSLKVGTTATPLIRQSPGLWYATTAPAGQPPGVVLSPTATTPVSASSTVGGVNGTVTKNIEWQLTDLANLPYGLEQIVVRPHDKLLVAVTGSALKSEIDTNFLMTFKPTHTGTATSKFQVSYTTPGTYVIQGRRDGVISGKVTVIVVGVDFLGPIACELGYRRPKEITVYPPTIGKEHVFLAANDHDQLLVTDEVVTANGLSFKLLPLSLGNRILQARIDGPGSPLISQINVDTFRMTTNATKSITVVQFNPDKSALARAELTMTPHIPNLTVTMTTFVSGITFDDSTTRKVISTTSFTKNGTIGTYVYQLLMAPLSYTNLCHTFEVSQAGVRISR